MNKYMGAKATTQTFLFEIPEERRTIAMHAQLQNTRLQVNPLLAAASLMMVNYDIDKVVIRLHDGVGEVMGLWVEDMTRDEEPWYFDSIVVERERLLVGVVIEDAEVIDGADAHIEYYELPRQAFLVDLMDFIARNDTTLLNPPPATGEFVQQKYLDNDGGAWDQTDDPLRFSTNRMKTGVDCTGWMEDAEGSIYIYVDYERDDNAKEPDDESVVLDDATLYLLAMRDDQVDGVVELMPYDELMVGDAYEFLILTPSF